MTTFKVNDTYLGMNIKETDYVGKLDDEETNFCWVLNDTEKYAKLNLNGRFIMSFENVIIEHGDGTVTVMTEDGYTIVTFKMKG